MSTETEVIALDAARKNNVTLDVMYCTGKRGGIRKMYRASSRRGYLCAAWSHTQADAIVGAH